MSDPYPRMTSERLASLAGRPRPAPAQIPESYRQLVQTFQGIADIVRQLEADTDVGAAVRQGMRMQRLKDLRKIGMSWYTAYNLPTVVRNYR